MSDLHLLHKRELRIEGIRLCNANLGDLAAAAADCLGADRSRVLVTDVRDDVVTLDLFEQSIDAENLLGKKEALLERLARLPGVELSERASLTSNGVLGWIALDEQEARRALARSEEMAEELRRRISRRAIVFSTGSEVRSGQIEDTNTPLLSERLEAEGYSVATGGALRDDEAWIAGALRRSVLDEGYGLVVTTGGVGAEDKDCTVEAVLAVDPDASTPYVARFEKGTGRHAKDGVRIAVGRLAHATLVALPGPTDEVQAALEVLIAGLKDGACARELAHSIARELRQKLARVSHPASH